MSPRNKKQLMVLSVALVLIIAAAGAAWWRQVAAPAKLAATVPAVKTDAVNVACQKYTEDQCPDSSCVICPNCQACSATSCHAADFCRGLGFDKSWFEAIKFNQKIIGWQAYQNDQHGFRIKYPEAYQMSDKTQVEPYYDSQITQVAVFSGQEKDIDGTTFTVYADNADGNLTSCLKNYDNQALTQTKNIGGYKFYVLWDQASDAAMGGVRGLLSQYHILHNGYCYILDLNVHWHEVGYVGVINRGQSDATPEETQAQKDAIARQFDILETMLATFGFVK